MTKPEIRLYESWMKPQVARLFSRQYEVTEEQFSTLIENFYDHPYQREKSIRIVALEGETVVGFQSFFYWPYESGGRTFRSYQSGNSLVHPDYRGKGIFAALLQFLDDHYRELGIDFLIGFPISASRNSLLRNGWKNILDLQWHVRMCSLLSLLPGDDRRRMERAFSNVPPGKQFAAPGGAFRLSHDPAFTSWRSDYTIPGTHFYFTYTANGHTAGFTLKCSRRKKIIRELVIGDVQCDGPESFLREAIKALIRTARKKRVATVLSFAANVLCENSPHRAFEEAGFRKIDRKIFFCVKNLSGVAPVEDASHWILYRSDIDTW